MKPRVFTQYLACMALFGAVALAQDASQPDIPAGKFYVADVVGVAEATDDKRIVEITEKSVFNAEGTVVETKPNSTAAIVMSNGVGLNLSSDTKLSIKRFQQDPFQPNRTDLETEPSMSQTRIILERGSLAISTSKLVAGSSMVLETPFGSLNVLSQFAQKATIQVNDNTITVNLLEGAMTLRGENMAGGQTLLPGQQAVIIRGDGGLAPSIAIQAIPKELEASLQDMVETASQARKAVYFDVAEKQVTTSDGTTASTTTQTELVPVVVQPVDPSEVGTVVSPARP